MRATLYLLLSAGAVMISNGAWAADLPLRVRPAVHREDPSTQEERRQLFERFLEYLRERRSH